MQINKPDIAFELIKDLNQIIFRPLRNHSSLKQY